MADFAPPTGPPPPKVPEGWKAIWNDEYKEWFYANIYTKKTQWNKPTEPIYPPTGESADGPPPYVHGESKPITADKTGLSSNNPYVSGGAGARPSNDLSEDERYARQLQAEEDARVRSDGQPQQGGASNSYYQGNNQAPGYGAGASSQPNPYTGQYDNTAAQKSSGSSGLLGKLKSKIAAASAGGSHGGQHGGMMGQGGYGYGQQPMYVQQSGYGHGGFYPPAGGPFGRPAKRPGMGGGAGLAMGGAAGLAGGMMLAGAADGFGGDDGGGYGGDDGGGFGGDDGGGFGGDGGGDFGGGDMGGGDF